MSQVGRNDKNFDILSSLETERKIARKSSNMCGFARIDKVADWCGSPALYRRNLTARVWQHWQRED